METKTYHVMRNRNVIGKGKLLLLTLATCFLAACTNNEEPIENNPNNETPKEYIVSLGFSGEITDITESPLSRAMGNDLYGIQVYSAPAATNGEYTPYAYGLFDDKDNIILVNSGLSEKNKKAYLKETISGLTGSKTVYDETENIITIYSIDSFLNGSPITFLKSDTEGEELNILKGAENTIKKYKPKMAISVYHKPDDLLTIPKFIKELVPEYNLVLRHHSKSFSETVLYCWTDQIRSDQIRSDQIRSDQIRSDQISM